MLGVISGQGEGPRAGGPLRGREDVGEDGLDGDQGKVFAFEQEVCLLGLEGGAVGAFAGEGVPDVTGGDQGGQGREVAQAVRVASSLFAFVVVGDGVEDAGGAVGPEAGGHLGAEAGVAVDVGEFVGGEAAGLVEEAGGEGEFAEVVEESGGMGVVGVEAEVGGSEAGEGGDAAGVGGVGLLAEEGFEVRRHTLMVRAGRVGRGVYGTGFEGLGTPHPPPRLFCSNSPPL